MFKNLKEMHNSRTSKQGLTHARTVSPITTGYHCPALLMFKLEIFHNRIILLQAHP